MSRFKNTTTGVVVSVDDSKDDRFTAGWEAVADEPAKGKKSAAKSDEK